jgi:protein ImuB
MGVAMLFACVFVPCFAVQASVRCEPEQKRLAWSNRPIAVFDGPDSLPRIFACNEQAQIAGVEIGVTKAQAAQCPGIILRKRDPKQEHAAQAALLDCASAFSPRVESTAQGILTLDIAGTERIFGPPQKLLRLLGENASRIGLEVNAAAAPNPDAALIGAKGFTGTTVIAAENVVNAIAQLPVDVLPLSQAQAEVLDSWGIRKCRELALLPPVPITERLGQAGLHLQRLARGEVIRTLVPVDPPLKFQESLEFEDSVEDLESLVFVLHRLLEQISARLVSRSLATDELRLNLGLEIREDRDVKSNVSKDRQDTFERTLKLPVSMQDTKVLLRLLQLDLAQHGPGAPVKRVMIEARPALRRFSQGGLFAPLAPEPEKLEVTLARIRGVVGEADEQGRGRVGSPEVLDSHKADEFRMTPFSTAEMKNAAGQNCRSGSITMSMFRPRLAADVRCRAGKPVHISFAEVSSLIISVAGPWSTSGNWWKQDEAWRHEEWDIAIQLSNGVGLYRIFRDLRQNAWFVEGLYD